MPNLLGKWQLVGSRLLEWDQGADCSGMVIDCSGEVSNSGSIIAAALGEPYIVQHGEGATARNCKQC